MKELTRDEMIKELVLYKWEQLKTHTYSRQAEHDNVDARLCKGCRALLKGTIMSNPVVAATDILYTRLRTFRAERNVRNLAEVVRAAKLVERLAYTPVIIKHVRAIQVCNAKLTWVGNPAEVACRKAFPDDEPGFAWVANA